MTESAASAVREPRQARSRAGWERALAAGRELLEAGGYEALTVSEVCRRAEITAPSLYARVDGRAGLFRAVYEDGMRDVAATEDELLGDARGIAELVAATTEIFDRHAPLLRAVIHRAVEDPWLLARGAETSRRLQQRIAQALPAGDAAANLSAARVMYTECAFRTIYGPGFWTPRGEPADSFNARLTAIVERIVAVSS